MNCAFDWLAAANLTLNLPKCDFAKAVVPYLGRKVGQGQVCPVEEKITAVEFPIPTTKRELRRLLGMTGYYRDFCKLCLCSFPTYRPSENRRMKMRDILSICDLRDKGWKWCAVQQRKAGQSLVKVKKSLEISDKLTGLFFCKRLWDETTSIMI